MKPERVKRYHDKINYILDNLKSIALQPSNDLEKKGIFYSIQTSIESIIDLIAMGVKDIGIQVHDDATNIANLENPQEMWRGDSDLNAARNMALRALVAA